MHGAFKAYNFVIDNDKLVRLLTQHVKANVIVSLQYKNKNEKRDCQRYQQGWKLIR